MGMVEGLSHCAKLVINVKEIIPPTGAWLWWIKKKKREQNEVLQFFYWT